MDHVEKIEVRNFRGLPDMATIRMADPEGKHVADAAVLHRRRDRDPARRPRRRSPAPVFIGEIVTFEPEFTSASATICVRAYDKSHRLHRNRAQRDLPGHDRRRRRRARSSASAGLQAGHDRQHDDRPQVPAAEHGVRPRLPQPARRAARTARSASPRARSFLAQQRNGSGAVPKLAWRENVKSFKPRMSASQQHDSVKVASYDPETKQRGRRRGHDAERDPAAGARRRATRRKAFGGSELLVADRVANSAERGARRSRRARSTSSPSGSFEAEGDDGGQPRGQGRRQAQARGLRQPLRRRARTSASVTHVYGHGDFRTRFAISGRNPRTLTDVMRPKAERDWDAGPRHRARHEHPGPARSSAACA